MKKLIKRLKFGCPKIQLMPIVIAAITVVSMLAQEIIIICALSILLIIVALYAIFSGKPLNNYYKYSNDKVHVIYLRAFIPFRMKIKRIFKKNTPKPGVRDMIKSSINIIDQLPIGTYYCITHDVVYKKLRKSSCITNLIVHDPCLYEVYRYKLQRACGERCKKDSTKYKMMTISFDIVR